MPTDHELLAAWRAGDGAAGNALVQRHYAGVYRFFRGKFGDACEELAQRTFMAFTRSRDRIDERGSVKAYLFGIARHELIAHFREQRRAQERIDPMERSIADLGGGAPSQMFAAQQERERLAAAMRQIPIDLQIVLELFYWEEMRVADIARVLACPEGTVKSRLFRARELVRARLSPATSESTLHSLGAADRLQRLR